MKKTITLLLALASIFVVNFSASALTYNVTVPTGTKTCYITGEMNGWSPSATPMTKVDETHYTLDLPNATAQMKYQYLSGPDWKYIEKDASGNAINDRTWSAMDVVVKWLGFFIPDERDVTIEALVPNDVVVLYLVGSFNSWNSPAETTKMSYVSEDPNGKVFRITVHSTDAKNMEFKFCAGPSWSYEQTSPTTNYVYGTTDNSTAVVVTSFKHYYDVTKAGTVNILATVPAGTPEVYIQGDFLSYNMNNAIKATNNNNGTFSFSLPNLLFFEYKLYNKADWNFPEANENGVERANRTAAYPTDANLTITVVAWKQNVSAISQTKEATNHIYSKDGQLIVDNVISKVTIYDISGRLIESTNFNGTFKSNKLNQGLYIVNVDGATKKVSVK